MSPSHFLSAPACARKVAHARTIQFVSYEREDGLLDLEALLEDTKPETFTTQTAHFPCGVPIHLMAIRLTVTRSMEVVQAEASMPRTPIPSTCTATAGSLSRLVGTNLLQGFRKEVASRIGSSDRCSHLSELASMLPTLAIQTMMKEQAAKELAGAQQDRPPAKIDGCHAWRIDGPAVLKFYPQWHRPPLQIRSRRKGAPERKT